MNRQGGAIQVLPPPSRMSPTITLLAIMGIFLGSIHGGINIWTGIGPEGGPVSALLIDPQNAANLYIGTSGGVYKSTDGAQTWSSINIGRTDARVSALAIDWHDSQNIYAGGYDGILFRTRDGGANWELIDVGPSDLRFNTLLVDPTNASIVYAGTSRGFYKSLDRGLTWSSLGLLVPVFFLTADTRNPNTLYAGAAEGLFKSLDGGMSWLEINTVNTLLGSPLYVGPIVIDPRNSSVLYFISRGLPYKSTDAGMTWHALGSFYVPSSYGPNSATLALNPQQPNVIYLTFSTFSAGSLYKSSDAGESWTHISDFRDAIVRLVVDPGSPNVLYLGTYLTGVYKSTDGGGTWRAADTGFRNISASALAIDLQNPQTLYAGTSLGLYKSIDRGGTWDSIKLGFRTSNIIALAIDSQIPATVYTVADDVYKSENGGASWKVINAGLPPSDRLYRITPLAIDPQNPNILYLAAIVRSQGPLASLSSALFKTTNRGEIWSRLSLGDTVLVLAVDPQHSNTIYAGTEFGGVLKSTDGGVNWKAVNTGVKIMKVGALAVDPQNPNIVYAGTQGGQLFKSTDSGATWDSVSSGLPFENKVIISALAIDPENPNNVFAGTSPITFDGSLESSKGVYWSPDGGINWSLLSRGLTGSVVQTLVIDPRKTNTVYAATGSGLFSITLIHPRRRP